MTKRLSNLPRSASIRDSFSRNDQTAGRIAGWVCECAAADSSAKYLFAPRLEDHRVVTLSRWTSA